MAENNHKAAATDSQPDWCRIVHVDGVTVLFFRDFDDEQGKNLIVAIARVNGAQLTAKMVAANDFSPEQFDICASPDTARTMLRDMDVLMAPINAKGVSKCLH